MPGHVVIVAIITHNPHAVLNRCMTEWPSQSLVQVHMLQQA